MAKQPHLADAQRQQMLTQAVSQRVVLREYLQLQEVAASRFSTSLGGRLIACAGFGGSGEELSLATTIAGGAFLGIESDAQHLKTAIRNATCDFMVNTLDEALRALKNEVRKGKPLSVGLLSAAPATFEAMVERGVQPDLIAVALDSEREKGSVDAPERRLSAETEAAIRELVWRGAIELDLDGMRADSRSIEAVWSADNLADLRRLDQAALVWLPPDDSVRRRWLERAGGAFHRHLPQERVLNMGPGELDSLLPALRIAGPFSSNVAVRWRGDDGSQRTVGL